MAMNISKLNSIITSKPVIACEIVVMAILGYLTVSGSFNHSPNPGKKAMIKQEAKAAKAAIATEEVAAAIDYTKNPFGDIRKFEDGAEDGTGMAVHGHLPSVPAIPHGNIPLPSIPGGLPMPGNPDVPAMPQVTAGKGVQGILTASDGSSVAIMPDGRVVTEGDTYADGRIAYIGGNGITFESGDFWSYGDGLGE